MSGIPAATAPVRRSEFNMLLKRARSRGRYRVEISSDDLEDLWRRQHGRCALTGLRLSFTHDPLTTLSLDRVDPNGHYTRDNIQLVCIRINLMKGNLLPAQFDWLCGLVVDRELTLGALAERRAERREKRQESI